MAKRIVFSDLHFGDEHCSLCKAPVSLSLKNWLMKQQPFDEMILAGDILEGNLSSLTHAMYGCKETENPWPGSFCHWLQGLFGAEEKVEVGRIVYIPGNHDYKIWDLLATEEMFTKPLAEGLPPKVKEMPLMKAEFSAPFISGVAPNDLRKKMIVRYPDYDFEIGNVKRRKVLVTHGHYLDKKQTLYKGIAEFFTEAMANGEDPKHARREFFKRTAIYQVGANSISFLEEARKLVGKTYFRYSSILEQFSSVGEIRHHPIDKDQLTAIEFYLMHFWDRPQDAADPDVFIYGHTHEAGHAKTNYFEEGDEGRKLDKVIDVWNTGGFMDEPQMEDKPLVRAKNWFLRLLDIKAPGPVTGPKHDYIGSFIFIDDQAEPGKEIQLFTVNKDGTIKLYLEGGIQ